jgi:TPR repeat protein
MAAHRRERAARLVQTAVRAHLAKPASLIRGLLAREPGLGVKPIAARLQIPCKVVRTALKEIAATRECAVTSNVPTEPEPEAEFVLFPVDSCKLCDEPLPWRVAQRDCLLCCRTFVCAPCMKKKICSGDCGFQCPLCKGTLLPWLAQYPAISLLPLIESDAWAQLVIGCFYRDGEQRVGGLRQNVRLAADLFEKAARQGSSDACVRLADLLLGQGEYLGHNDKKRGVRKDIGRGLRLMRLAADAGNTLAQFNMGFMIDRGEHELVKDFPAATRWFKLAAEQGHEEAQKEYAMALIALPSNADNGLAASALLSFQQMSAAAEAGEAGAMKMLAAQYLDQTKGAYPPPDLSKAVYWLKRVLESTETPKRTSTLDVLKVQAMFDLGTAYSIHVLTA